MKLNKKPLLLRTIIGEVKYKSRVYQITFREDLSENHYEVFLLDEMGSLEEEISLDSDLGIKLTDFFERETEDIEQFN